MIGTDAVPRLLACLLLGACTNISPGSPPTVELDKRYATRAAPTAALTPEEKTKVQNAVLSKLKNPDTAQFGFMNATQGEGGIVNVCGWVNEKNYLGRWERYRPFYARYLPVNQQAVLVTLAAESDPRYVKGQCRENGVPLSEQPSSI
ncbi:MAG TPA: hypothetical protein VM144_00400 [Aestuariivirga sp.]|nr:hypothetical protein [Aestuariivirga sp.]